MFQLIQNVPLFSGISSDGIEKLLSQMVIVKLTPNQVLFREGDVGTSMYIVMNGKIKIYHTSPKGDEKTITIFKKGDSFGELALIDGEPRSASAKALTFSELIKLDAFSFHELLQENYNMVKAILIELAKRIRKTNAQVQDLVFLDAKTLVVKTLINLANEHGKRVGLKKVQIDVPLTMQEIANLSGISIEVVEYVIQYLIQRNFLTVEKGLYQLDLSKK